MIYSENTANVAERINPVVMCNYLRNTGWDERKITRTDIKIFQHPLDDGTINQVTVPMSKDLSDYDSAMRRAVSRIAETTGKDTDQILTNLLNPSSDVLRLRVIREDVESGSIGMDDALSLFENTKKLIVSAAMDIRNHNGNYSGRADQEIREFVSNCRFGQTEVGSYVISVICPLGKRINGQIQTTLNRDEKQNSLARNVINKILTDVPRICREIDDGTIAEKYDDSGNPQKNTPEIGFMDALGKLGIQKTGTVVQISARYDPTVPGNTLDEGTVEISSNYYDTIREIVDSRKMMEPDEKDYVGMISVCSSEPNTEKRRKGLIKIVCIDENMKRKTIKVVLGVEDYNKALDAHQKGKYVKVVGKISENGKIECKEFSVLN